jgi:hypothetical protein
MDVKKAEVEVKGGKSRTLIGSAILYSGWAGKAG